MDPRKLREETRPEHEATEALMPLGGEGLTREVYVSTLRVLLPLVRSWEQWAEASAPADLEELLRVRRRSQWLEDDLLQLTGDGSAATVVAPPWAEVTREQAAGTESFRAAFLGTVYVMEGSTLGGRFLARHVEAVLGLEPGRGDAYFQGHGERTGAMWKEVVAQLTAIPDALGPVVITAARRAFGIFGEVLQAGVPQPAPDAVRTFGSPDAS